MPITITAADVRRLINADNPDSVLYLDTDDAGAPARVDVWVAAYVQNYRVIITRADLVDWLGEDVTDEDIAEYLEELQQKVDEVIERVSA